MSPKTFLPKTPVMDKMKVLIEQKKQEKYLRENPPKPQPVVVGPKTGRNDPCPCGSGKKYKKCCLAQEG